MRQHRSRIPLGVLGAVLVAIVAAGCGFGASPGTKHASIEVTSGFGTSVIGTATETNIPGSETVMSLLERRFKVNKRDGGNVGSINGRSGGSGQLDWAYYVNGILGPKRPSAMDVNKGDHIWWDLHDVVAARTIPAVVGSYPEPFTDGIGGHEFPTVLSCGAKLQSVCAIVADSLHKAGVKAADQYIGTGSGSDSLAVVVGTWNQIKGIIAAELIAGGPADSGVYAQFIGGSGQAIELLNPLGDVVQTLRGNVGLIAATDEESLGQPTWFVTGTDVAGVEAAAKQLTPAKLHNHFAIVVQGAHVTPVPVVGNH